MFTRSGPIDCSFGEGEIAGSVALPRVLTCGGLLDS
jgi:hypothetical protein